jgi:peptidoglycan/LPS O-acetylase OafA/YrhL/glycosyltransferase involved in cell wall biosynthesis
VDEILVYDDASSHPPEPYLPDGLRVRVIRGSRTSGPGFGRNVLLSKSQSDYIHFHDADDWFQPNWGARVRRAIDEKHVDAVFTEIASYRDGAIVNNKVLDLERFLLSGDLIRFCVAGVMLVPAGTYLRSSLLKMGGYRPGIWQSEDFDFHVRLALSGISYAVLTDPLVVIRLRSEGRSSNQVEVWACFVESLRLLGNEVPASYKRDLAERALDAGCVLFRLGEKDEARKAFALAEELGPPYYTNKRFLFRNVARLAGPEIAERVALCYRALLPEPLRRAVGRNGPPRANGMNVVVKVEFGQNIAAQAKVPAALKADSRIPALDGLRGVASLMVLAYHFGPHIVRDSGSPFLFLHRIPVLWFEGVDLFFVLSGFLISGILMDARESPRYFQTFYARRFFRIFPLYYLVLFGYGITIALWDVNTSGRLFEDPLPFWTYTLYLQNFAMAATNTFGAIWMAGSWSLAIEEQFYLTLPALIRRVSDRGLFRVAVAGFAGAPILRALIQRYKFVPAMTNYVLLPTRVDSLAVGVLVMLIMRHRQEWLMRHRRAIVWATVAVFLAWTLYPYVPNPQAIRLGFINHTITAIAFGASLLSVLLLPTSFTGKLLSTGLMRNVGNMAYSTYLFHPILLCAVFRVLRSKDPALERVSDLGPLAIAGVTTLVLSWISWSQFESRLLRIGHRFQY